MVEQRNHNPCVMGSIPFASTSLNVGVAKWLCSGLQIRPRGFDSLLRLHFRILSSVGLERFPYKEEAVDSNSTGSTITQKLKTN